MRNFEFNCILSYEDPFNKIVGVFFQDDIGEFKMANGEKAFYVSFLDGMQRVFLFTLDMVIAREAQNAGDIELFDQEILLSLHGIGLSLVENRKQCEILYIGITRYFLKLTSQLDENINL